MNRSCARSRPLLGPRDWRRFETRVGPTSWRARQRAVPSARRKRRVWMRSPSACRCCEVAAAVLAEIHQLRGHRAVGLAGQQPEQRVAGLALVLRRQVELDEPAKASPAILTICWTLPAGSPGRLGCEFRPCRRLASAESQARCQMPWSSCTSAAAGVGLRVGPAGGLDVLVDVEGVVWVVAVLDLGEPVVVAAVGRFDPVLALVHQEVDVGAAG